MNLCTHSEDEPIKSSMMMNGNANDIFTSERLDFPSEEAKSKSNSNM